MKKCRGQFVERKSQKYIAEKESLGEIAKGVVKKSGKTGVRGIS